MTQEDLSDVERIGDQAHPALPESIDVFANRQKLFPDGCLVLADKNLVCGYVISHPIRRDQPPALNTLLDKIDPDADQYYIHDIAVAPEWRGERRADDAIHRLLGIVDRDYGTSCLISVYGTGPFWQRFGFRAMVDNDEVKEKIRGYGEDAVYMTRVKASGASA